MKKIKDKYFIIIIILLAFISVIPMFINAYVHYHDSSFHLSVINSIKKMITDNNISLILPNGLGFGTMLFYPTFIHKIVAVFSVTTHIDTFYSISIIYLIISILSGLSMYYLVLKIRNNKISALLSSCVYILMPYRMTNMLARGALNESFLFIGMPLVFLSIYYLFKNDYKYFYLFFIVGYLIILQSQIVLALYFSFIVLLFLLFNYKKIFKKERIKALIIATLLVSIIISPYLVNLIETSSHADYLVFKENFMTSAEMVKGYTSSLSDFIDPLFNSSLRDYDWFTIIQGVNILVIVLIIINIYKDIKKKNKSLIFYYVLALLSLIMMTDLIKWEYMPNFLLMIQFPFRFNSFLCFTLAILAGISIKNTTNNRIISIILIALLLIPTLKIIDYYSQNPYDSRDYLTEDYTLGNNQEYLPVKYNKNIVYLDNITTINDDVPTYIFTYNLDEENELELPRIYYYGYELLDEDNVSYPLSISDNGLIKTTLNKKGKYMLHYTGSVLYNVTNIVSKATIVVLFILFIKRKKKRKHSS